MEKPSINTIAIKNFIANFMIPLIALGIIAGLFVLIILPSLNEIPILKEDLEQKQMKANGLQKKYNQLSNCIRLSKRKEIVNPKTGPSSPRY